MIAARPTAAPVHRTVLPNGLVILSEFVAGVRSVSMGAWVRAASAHEARREMGISHLLEHLVFKGTARRTARDLALALEARGGSLDAYTSREHTSFQAYVLDRDLPVAADVLHDLVFNPLLREQDLVLERQVVLDEIAMVHDTPDDLVFEEHNARLWGEHPFGYSILGTPDSVRALRADDLRERHRLTYTPANIVVALAGNVDHEHVVATLVEAGWGAVGGTEADRSGPAAAATPLVVPAIPAHPAATGTPEKVPHPSQQAHIVFGSRTIPLSDPSRPAFLVVSALLGGGMSSRLFQRIREEMGLAYSVYGFQSLYSAAGMHGVYVGTAPETAGRAMDAVRDELKRLVDDGIAEDELAVGREQLVGQYLLSLESPGARMQRAASCELHGEPFRTVDEVAARIEGVTAADALAVARAWFVPDAQTVVILGPE